MRWNRKWRARRATIRGSRFMYLFYQIYQGFARILAQIRLERTRASDPGGVWLIHCEYARVTTTGITTCGTHEPTRMKTSDLEKGSRSSPIILMKNCRQSLLTSRIS